MNIKNKGALLMPIKYKPSYQEIIIKILKLKQRNRFLQHKANEYDRYLSSECTYPIKIVANNYGLTSTQVNHILENNSIQYKIHNHWYLTNKYANQELAKIVLFYISKDFIVHHLRWTTRGLIFVSKILEKHGYKRKGEQIY